MRMLGLLPGALLATLSCVPGCSEELPPPEPDRPTIDERLFTATLSDLVVARIQLLPDTTAYTRRADEILREHGVSEDDLRTFVEVHGQNDDRMTRSYARVSARLDTLFPIVPPGAVQPEGGAGAEAAIPAGAVGAADSATASP